MNLINLVPAVLEKSESRKLHWEASGDNSYLAPIANFILAVEKVRAPTGIYTKLSLLNEQGVTIEAVNLTAHDSALANRLFAVAKRRALGVDEAMQSLEAALKKL